MVMRGAECAGPGDQGLLLLLLALEWLVGSASEQRSLRCGCGPAGASKGHLVTASRIAMVYESYSMTGGAPGDCMSPGLKLCGLFKLSQLEGVWPIHNIRMTSWLVT
jgi:hypothetical protein